MSLLCGCFSPDKNDLIDEDFEAYTMEDDIDKGKINEDTRERLDGEKSVEKPSELGDVSSQTLQKLDTCEKKPESETNLSFNIGALSKLRESNIPELNQVLQEFTDSGVQSLIDSGEIDEVMAAELASLINRLESVTVKLESVASRTGATSSSVQDEEIPQSVLVFDGIVNGPLKAFLDHSRSIGGDVGKQAEMVSSAFHAERDFLLMAAKSKQPDDAGLAKLLGPISEQIQAVQNFREQNRKSQFFNHLSALSESLPAIGWVAITPAPAPFVKEMNDAGQFYTNRVLKDWKEKDKIHVEWVKTWIQVLNELQAFVKQHHTTGLVWNPQGGVASSVPAAAAKPKAIAAPTGGPPPPPMGGLDMSAPPKENDADKSRNQLFAALNKGEDVTRGLKKVTSEMQTHKNPGLRSGPAPFKSASPSATGAPQIAPKPTDKPPKFTLDGKKWIVEYQKNQPSLSIAETEMNQVVYMFKCENTTLQVKGKLNSIIVDSCKKTAIVFDSVVSSVEFVNCQSVQVQVLGSVPTVSIDKTDGCQIYLSKNSLQAEIVSAKSSEMNVLVPKDDGDYVEFAVPEQYKTTYNGKGLTTTMTEIA